uniref:Syntaxin 6/10/61 N-terminal domain-containing protein n=1 Tax=Cyprinus carpio TaxID=7962 RepID=A0A8C1YRT3_CYPCA
MYNTNKSNVFVVQKALSKARGLFERWEELLQEETPVSRDELDWSTNELRNCLR